MNNIEKLFVTADLHFFHKEIMSFFNRPFSNVEEMNNALVENWNKKVPKDGKVLLLGDVCFRQDIQEIRNIFDKLNGEIYLIKGNHDNVILENKILSNRFYYITDYNEFDIKTEIGQRRVVLSHYPMASWNESFIGRTFMLHGHTHNRYKPNIGHILDVGVDNPFCNFAPLAFNQVVDYMKNRTTTNI